MQRGLRFNQSPAILIIALAIFPEAYTQDFEVTVLDNSIFNTDRYWKGADGAATVDLEDGRILWLFSDTFINPRGRDSRKGSKMINNSIAIQDSPDLWSAPLTYYYNGTPKDPGAFFDNPGDSWFWTGHGIMLNKKLLVFLMETLRTTEGLGFQTIGWYAALIDNPLSPPAQWEISYVKGPDTFGVIVGSSAVLKDENYLYAFGVKEPATHEVFLMRYVINDVEEGLLDNPQWWVNGSWTGGIDENTEVLPLFIGQTEFSVHYDTLLKKYIQIQTIGFGNASLGYRFSDRLEGPWSEPVIFYTPPLEDSQEFVYTANAHPELDSEDLIITYNVNNFDFGKLIGNMSIYYPRLISLKIDLDK